MPAFLPAAVSASAAMNVWAIPVAHAVTATMRAGRPSTLSPSATAAVVGAAAAAAGAAAGAASPSPIALRTIATTSSALVAARRPAVKSSCMRLRASFDSTARWASAAPSGAAMRKTRSAGPSDAPKSTPGFSRANASDGVTTAELFACGIAMPPGRPVSSFCSRAHASANSASGSVARPCSATRAARARITAALSAPSGVSRDTNSGVMVWDTMTSNGRWCGLAGVGGWIRCSVGGR